jgi:PAS domain S-box-containing protein
MTATGRTPGVGRPVSIGRSFLVWLVGVLLTVLVVVSALVLRHEQSVLEAELRERAEVIGSALAVAVAGDGPTEILAVLPLNDLRAGEVRDPGGRVLWSWGPPIQEAIALEPGAVRVTVDATARPEVPGGGERRLEVELIVSRTRLNAHIAAAAVRLALGLGIALPLAMLLGMAVVGRIARPLARLSDWVRDFRVDEPRSMPDLAGAPTEVDELARAFGDMTRRLVAQRHALAASEARFRGLFSASPSALLELDDDLVVYSANAAAGPLLGCDPDDAVGRPLGAWLDVADLDRVREAIGDGSPEPVVEAAWHLADGARAAVELHLRPLASEVSTGVLVAVWDVTDRVRRAGERWRRTFDAMVDGVALVEGDGAVTLANLALENHLEVLRSELERRARDGGSQSWELRSRGRLLRCVLTSPPDLEQRVLVVRDVTDEAEAESRLREAETMEAVGALASGVAHDFNNLLAAIQLHARLVGRDPEAAEDAATAIRRLADEGSDVVRELLLYARREGTPPRPLDLVKLVRSQESLLRHLLPPEIELHLVAVEGAVPVSGNPVALRRMVLNLVLNARDAVAPRGGLVTVRVDADDGRARLEVSDDGPGIAAEHRDRIFEPFFSLRRLGRGAGLGLAVVHRVVTDHGGQLAVDSDEGRGTRVTVRLPMCRADELDAEIDVAAVGRVLVIGSGREAVAVMEALAQAGFEPRHAPQGADLATVVDGWQPDLVLSVGADAVAGKAGGHGVTTVAVADGDEAVRTATAHLRARLGDGGTGGLES